MILTQNQLDLENSLRRILPPDVVSLWIPDGYNRAKDIIRGNHGQCYGTHPNVPVLPSLINPAVGWYFDGTDDYVEVPHHNSLNLASSFTIGAWVNLSGDYSLERTILAKQPSGASIDSYPGNYEFRIKYITGKLELLLESPVGSIHTFGSDSIIDRDQWKFLVATFTSGQNSRIYINSVLDKTISTAVTTPAINENTLFIGRRRDAARYFDGYIALPFIANKAWSQAQVKNFYLHTKSLFAPRG